MLFFFTLDLIRETINNSLLYNVIYFYFLLYRHFLLFHLSIFSKHYVSDFCSKGKDALAPSLMLPGTPFLNQSLKGTLRTSGSLRLVTGREHCLKCRFPGPVSEILIQEAQDGPWDVLVGQVLSGVPDSGGFQQHRT